MIAAILSNWRTIAISSAVSVAVGFAVGWAVRGWKEAADQWDDLIAALDARTEREAKLQERAEGAEDKLAEIGNQTRIIYRKVPNETRNDSYRCPVPASGVQLLNQARTGVEPDTSGEPDGEMP